MGKLLNYKRENRDFVSICAPMVRYSKLPFRLLVRELGCDLAYTPMIMADAFVKSEKARQAEFSTCSTDRPLIVQFASRNSGEFLQAAELIFPFADGVDLNCGCPQRWALNLGVGGALSRDPALIADMVGTVRRGLAVNQYGSEGKHFSVSVKTRICDGPNGTARTIDMLRQLDHMGVDWVTVHARTATEKNEPARWAQLGEIVSLANVNCDTVVNGDITSFETATLAQKITGSLGVMSARGILANPAVFSEAYVSPLSYANRYVELAALHGAQFSQIHQHVFWMLEPSLSRSDRSLLHALGSFAGLVEFINKLSINDFVK